MPPRKGAPNRRGAARREQILDAAVELFAQRGYRGSGLLELAERVGMTHAGILHHFGTKEDLLRAVMARRDEILDRQAGDFEGKGIAGLRDIRDPFEPPVYTRLATVLRIENLDPDDPLHDYFVAGNQRVRALVADEIRRGQQAGEIRTDVDPDIKAIEILAFSIGIETQWLLEPHTIDRARVFRSFLRSLLSDLTPAKSSRVRQPNG
jgi:AcrR family transcriptional regulator